MRGLDPGDVMALVAEMEVMRAGEVRWNGQVTERGPEALVQLMGRSEGLPAPLIYRKAWALLGYLAVESGRMHARTSLAALLWPELGETSALTNLRQVLCNLNRYCVQTWGPDVLRVERSAVGLMRAQRQLFDIDLLVHAPCQAVRLATGQRSFLDGMEDIAGPDFHAWLETARQNLEGQLIGAAERCCDELLGEQQWERALQMARGLTQRDPWNEGHARRMMRAHAGSGMHTAALKVYECLETLLREELGLDPTQETQQLQMQIHAASIPAPARVLYAVPVTV
ncbi:BTAD domain-containing putative transcriptional regulator [Stenotrophomonas sp. SY1]|uniref:AfsR/SARP family transcriptional regulator n=1 Tax=Stenotrophomonas sp. SY1 TaxID=477235 RepID=UPI001E3D39C1|nr:BTAD domain-containing putative transcriptional regulator [Stenotrophomonas sp. SY1]MCD9088078.1 hypothetical protein [Stenotrophomonas sp. SY1]